jgi:hypothetical protein
MNNIKVPMKMCTTGGSANAALSVCRRAEQAVTINVTV